MGPRQQTHFGTQRAQVLKVATVTTLFSIKDADSERFFLEVVERLGNFKRGRIGVPRENGGLNFFPEDFYRSAAPNFPGRVESSFDAVSGDLVCNFNKIIADIQKRDLALRLAGDRSEFALHLDNVANIRTSELECLDKIFFGQL